MYKVKYDQTSVLKTDKKNLKQDHHSVNKIRNAIELLMTDPFSEMLNVKILSPKVEKKYRLRVGNYRIIYSIDIGNEILLIHRIAHRKDIYK